MEERLQSLESLTARYVKIIREREKPQDYDEKEEPVLRGWFKMCLESSKLSIKEPIEILIDEFYNTEDVECLNLAKDICDYKLKYAKEVRDYL